MFLQIRVFKRYIVAYETQKCIELEMRLYDLKVRADIAQRRREIAQGRHRGLVINLARVTIAKLNCCTECLASLSSTVFMYASVTIYTIYTECLKSLNCNDFIHYVCPKEV